MKMLKSKLIVLALVSTLALPARAALCPPYAEAVVMAANTAMKVAIEMFVRQLFDLLGLQIFNFGKIKVTAVKIMTSQVATAAKAQINANIALAQGEMAAIGSMETTKQQLKVYQDFSALIGQGVDPCAQLAAQTAVTVANGQAISLAADAISHLAAAPGRYGNAEMYTDRLLRQRQLLFATPDEVTLGYGVGAKTEVVTATGERFSLAGADTNARVLFADSKDPLVKTAREAYLNYVAGPPDRAITQDVAALPAGRDYLGLKRRKDAVLSTGLHSLAMVGAEHTPNPELGDKSKMQAMREMVGQYYGEAASGRWKGWTSQSQRGLLVDQVKLNAAQLALEADLLAQSQRQEALLGSLLAMEASREHSAALAGSAAGFEQTRVRPAVR